MKHTLFVIWSLVFVAACKGDEPHAIESGRERCAFCCITIATSEFESQALTATGRHVHFDSIECLSAWTLKQATPPRTRWVKDFENRNWLDMNTASIVRSDATHSPMAVNLAAFTDTAKAAAFVKNNGGKILSARTLEELIAAWSTHPASHSDP